MLSPLEAEEEFVVGIGTLNVCVVCFIVKADGALLVVLIIGLFRVLFCACFLPCHQHSFPFPSIALLEAILVEWSVV